MDFTFMEAATVAVLLLVAAGALLRIRNDHVEHKIRLKKLNAND